MTERQEIELNVSGKSCQGCEQALTMVPKQHETVDSAAADHKAGKVRVTLNRDVDLAEIKEWINSAGYEAQ